MGLLGITNLAFLYSSVECQRPPPQTPNTPRAGPCLCPPSPRDSGDLPESPSSSALPSEDGEDLLETEPDGEGEEFHDCRAPAGTGGRQPFAIVHKPLHAVGPGGADAGVHQKGGQCGVKLTQIGKLDLLKVSPFIRKESCAKQNT